MPTAKNNLVTKGLSGMVGNQLVFVKETKGKREYMRNRPKKIPKSKESEAQRLHRFKYYKEGSRYWKSVKARPELLREYEKIAESPRNAYNMAMEDHMHDPVITKFTLSQSKTKHNPVVQIQAINLIRLKEVYVKVYNMEGQLLEDGEAVITKTITNWKYTFSVVTNPIPEIIVQVIATDFPRNVTHASKHFIQGKKDGIPIPEKVAVRRVIDK